jgi:hypothetical protein
MNINNHHSSVTLLNEYLDKSQQNRLLNTKLTKNVKSELIKFSSLSNLLELCSHHFPLLARGYQ